MAASQALSAQVKDGLGRSRPAGRNARKKEVFLCSGSRFGHFGRPTLSPAVTYVVQGPRLLHLLAARPQGGLIWNWKKFVARP